MDTTPRRHWFIEIGRVLGATSLVTLSLLTFPSHIPWMILIWVSTYSLRIATRKPAWPFLAVCAAVLLVKRVPMTATLIGLLAAMLLAGLSEVARKRSRSAPTRLGTHVAMLTVSCVWVFWGILTIDWHLASRSSRAPTFDPARPIVCLGDSLTSGVSPYGGYPAELQRVVTVPVVNLGRAGISTDEAFDDLPKLVQVKPQTVVIELGGHDFLKGHTRAATKANITKIVSTCRDIDAEVILMEIPRGFIVDSYSGLERQVARDEDLELISDTTIRKLVLWSPFAPPGMWFGPERHLSDDGLHPNSRGNRLLAETIATSVAQLFGPTVRAREK